MIISCGDTLIDMLPRHLETGGNVFLPVAGGAIFNTAIALGRLGQPIGLLAGVSTDMFGDQLMQSLENSNVNTDYCVRSDRPTTMAYVRLVDGNARYHFVDENSAQRMLDIHDLKPFPDTVTTLHFGGICLIAEPCGSFFEECMRQNADHKIISFDPNIRPSFIKDETSYRQRINHMLSMSDIIKLSDEDFEWLNTGKSFADFAQFHIDNGASLVIQTQGSKDIEFFTSHGKHNIPVKSVKVVDTVGAGDTFNAGVLASLSKQNIMTKSSLKTAPLEILEQAISLGIDVSAFTIQQAGANPPWAEQLS